MTKKYTIEDWSNDFKKFMEDDEKFRFSFNECDYKKWLMATQIYLVLKFKELENEID